MTKQYVLIEPKKIDAAIKSIGQRSKLLDQDIHATAIQCLLHADKHGDPRKMDNLLKALGRAHRAEALKVWVAEFSPIAWNGDGVVGIHPKTSKKFKPFAIESADATPFWELTEEKASKPLTFEALKKIIAGLSKRVEKAETDGTVAVGENVIEMKAWIAKVQAAAA